MAPFVLETLMGHAGANVVYFCIGLAFGAVLEMAGFAWSPKLAAQFYFKDITVLKVMFTAIIVAMVCMFLFSALEWIDYRRVWVNPTYLWPGVVGGLIMGAGFIIGGFCPGTSLVAVATLKIDGMFFALGVLFGIFIFGETNSQVSEFWNGSYLGRLTLPEWLGVETGWVVLGVVLMAIFLFWGGSLLEQSLGGRPKPTPRAARMSRAGALLLVILAGVTLLLKQPTTADQWSWVQAEKEILLKERDVYIQPAELLNLMKSDTIYHRIFDIRDEKDFNLFHIATAERVPLDQIDPLAFDILQSAKNPVVVLVSNGEQESTEAWKALTSQGVINLYILEGGINAWLDTFGHDGHEYCPANGAESNETLLHELPAALSDRYEASDPDPGHHPLEFTPKIKVETKAAAKKGGCG